MKYKFFINLVVLFILSLECAKGEGDRDESESGEGDGMSYFSSAGQPNAHKARHSRAKNESAQGQKKEQAEPESSAGSGIRDKLKGGASLMKSALAKLKSPGDKSDKQLSNKARNALGVAPIKKDEPDKSKNGSFVKRARSMSSKIKNYFNGPEKNEDENKPPNNGTGYLSRAFDYYKKRRNKRKRNQENEEPGSKKSDSEQENDWRSKYKRNSPGLLSRVYKKYRESRPKDTFRDRLKRRQKRVQIYTGAVKGYRKMKKKVRTKINDYKRRRGYRVREDEGLRGRISSRFRRGEDRNGGNRGHNGGSRNGGSQNDDNDQGYISGAFKRFRDSRSGNRGSGGRPNGQGSQHDDDSGGRFQRFRNRMNKWKSDGGPGGFNTRDERPRSGGGGGQDGDDPARSSGRFRGIRERLNRWRNNGERDAGRRPQQNNPDNNQRGYQPGENDKQNESGYSRRADPRGRGSGGLSSRFQSFRNRFA